jgi:hypothetical protein
MAVDLPERGSELRVRLRRRLAGTTGQKDQGVGRGSAAHGGDDRDPEIDRSSIDGRSIFADPERPAARGDARMRAGSPELAGSEREGGRFPGLRRASGESGEKDGPGATHEAAGR